MLCWTKSGAVPWPTTVQIRLAQKYEQRIVAGAPHPSRQLSIEEFRDNAHYFRVTLHTSRSKPCDSITLTALHEENPKRIAVLSQILQDLQYRYIRAHIDHQSQHLIKSLDFAHHISLAIRHPTDWAKYELKSISPRRLYISILLNNDTLPHLFSLFESFPQGSHITLLYPFPLSDTLIHTAPNIPALQKILKRVSKNINIAGLPQCLSYRQGKKTSNRWYVDADNQKEQALLFFPDLLRYYKSESCRFCTENAFCDGFFVDYLNETVQLKPL